MASMTAAPGQNGVAVATAKPLNGTFAALPTTIFTVMTNLALENQSINLGQGFPEDEGPSSMKVEFINHFMVSLHQSEH